MPRHTGRRPIFEPMENHVHQPMESPDVAHIIRLFPEAAPPGHNEDNGALLGLIVHCLPSDLVQPVAAASRALNTATAGILPEQCRLPQVSHARALGSGNLPALRRYWADAAPGSNAAGVLAENGHLAALQWLFQIHDPTEYQQNSAICVRAAQNGEIVLLRWARANGCAWGPDTCEYAAGAGHLEILQWARTQVPPCPWNKDTYLRALIGGHLETLQWAHANGCPLDDTDCTVSCAAQYGHTHILQWALEQEFPWGEDACSHAAMNGHLGTLQWLHAHGCPWDERTCSSAAKKGHLAILRWARTREPPCPWGENTCTHAAMNGHLETLQWARAAGCPWNTRTCAHAANTHSSVNNLPVLRWLRGQNPPCPWDSDVCIWAAGKGNLAILRWARALDPPCPWNYRVITAAERSCYPNVAAWARDNGCPEPP